MRYRVHGWRSVAEMSARCSLWIDDLTAAKASVDRMKTLNVLAVYPGHGKPFPWEAFVKKYARAPRHSSGQTG